MSKLWPTSAILVSLTLGACTLRPPEQEAPSRLPARFVFEDPRKDTAAASASYHLLFAGSSALSDSLSSEHEMSAPARLVEEAVMYLLGFFWLTVHHEFGHYRVADQLGGDPEIHLQFNSGSVTPNFPAGSTQSREDYLEFYGAGVNQSTLSAMSMERGWARQGTMSSHEALGYVIAKLDLPRYLSRTVRNNTHKSDNPGTNDMVAYVGILDRSMSEQDLLWMSAAATGLSAPFWSALGGQYRFLAENQRRVEIPSVDLNGIKCTLPSFDVMLGRSGPLLGARFMVGTNLLMPWELSIDVSPYEDASAMGLRLFDLTLGDRVRLSPFARVSNYSKSNTIGSAFGTDITVPIAGGVSAAFEVSYRHRDLLSQVEGYADGVQAFAWVQMQF